MPAYKGQKRNIWYVRFRYKDWQNQQRWAAKRGFPTKREALRWEQEFRQRQAGDLDMPFRDFIKVYSEDRTPRLKESAVAMKENIIDTKLLYSVCLPSFLLCRLLQIRTAAKQFVIHQDCHQFIGPVLSKTQTM